MNSNRTHCALLLLLAALTLSEAAFNCQVSLSLSGWPSVVGLTPVLTKVRVAACGKTSGDATVCDLESTSGSVIWYNTTTISYETAPNGPEFADFHFANSTGPPTNFVFASSAAIFMSSKAPPYYKFYTFESGGNLGLADNSATSQVAIDEEGTQTIAFKTLFRCEDECTDA